MYCGVPMTSPEWEMLRSSATRAQAEVGDLDPLLAVVLAIHADLQQDVARL